MVSIKHIADIDLCGISQWKGRCRGKSLCNPAILLMFHVLGNSSDTNKPQCGGVYDCIAVHPEAIMQGLATVKTAVINL